ncbi:glucose-6-phosphate isomerase [Sphingomonas sp.]|uniref:glucose-6-phosphate isomerase n=1 Tax=Sphingomonas sp. TaxID=28214 RepID=UPI003752FBBE
MTKDPWAAIDGHSPKRLTELFAENSERLATMSLALGGMYFDWSKTHLDERLVAAFEALAGAQGFAAKREALFTGAVVNASEGRAATHVAERGSGSAEHNDLAAAGHLRMRALVDAIEAEAFGDVTGVLHIGIGGSALGPDLVIDALGHDGTRYDVRVLSNIDGQAFEDAVSGLDPATTLVAVVSKTFTTTETLTNLNAALAWLEDHGVGDAFGRVIAITAAPEAAIEYGIDSTRILPFGETVGGRYSLWSTVGFSVALALGWPAFEELLEGAAEIDRHFRFSEGRANAPLMAAFADLTAAQVLGCATRAVFAYDERLRLLPSYLQQLEMESNGKSVGAEGAPVGRKTAPVTWGGVGTDAQHAVFQLLHQGTGVVPVEFVAVIEQEDGQDDTHHRQLLLNAFAQGAALMTGRESDDGAKAYPGNRPSSAILLDRLDPRTLGALLAFYEHRTFANAVLLGINPFDQFGVELGKQMARAIDDPATRERFDPSTRALIERAGL